MTQIYTTTYKGYTMPARVWSGSGKDNYWCGINVLGPLMGVKRIGTNAQSQIDAVERIAKVLRCPASNRNRDLDPAALFTVDYTYNSNLGDDRSIRYNGDGTANPSFKPEFEPWANFKKRTQVPDSVVVALDSTDVVSTLDPDYQRFGVLSDLTTANATSRPWPRAGHNHPQNKANVLFHGGQVSLVRAFSPKPGILQPTTFDPTTTQLANWMILSPGNLINAPVAATYYGTVAANPPAADNVWKKGRPLPNF